MYIPGSPEPGMQVFLNRWKKLLQNKKYRAIIRRVPMPGALHWDVAKR